MALTNVQFSVATHILAALGYHYTTGLTSTVLAESVNAEPTFVRRAVAKLSKAGLLVATRGCNGRCMLSRAPEKISLLEIYRASEAPPTFSIHTYPIEQTCPISSNIKGSMKGVLDHAQDGFEKSLAKQTLADVVAAVKAGEKEALASRGKKRRVAKSA